MALQRMCTFARAGRGMRERAPSHLMLAGNVGNHNASLFVGLVVESLQHSMSGGWHCLAVTGGKPSDYATYKRSPPRALAAHAWARPLACRQPHSPHRMVLGQVGAKAQDLAVVDLMDGAGDADGAGGGSWRRRRGRVRCGRPAGGTTAGPAAASGLCDTHGRSSCWRVAWHVVLWSGPAPPADSAMDGPRDACTPRSLLPARPTWRPARQPAHTCLGAQRWSVAGCGLLVKRAHFVPRTTRSVRRAWACQSCGTGPDCNCCWRCCRRCRGEEGN